MKTIVVFRKWKKDGEIIALFPRVSSATYNCSSYMHVGQHGSADYALCIRATVPATEAEYADLKRELENYGPPDAHYDLEVRTRKPNWRLCSNI